MFNFSAIGECTDAVEEWHRTYQLCPGFADKVNEGAMNQNFAYYFWEFTGFNWLTCFEETGIYSLSYFYNAGFQFPYRLHKDFKIFQKVCEGTS